MDQGGGAGSSGEKSEAIKGSRDGGTSHGPGATAALYPCRGLAAEHTESTVHPGTQVPRVFEESRVGNQMWQLGE